MTPPGAWRHSLKARVLAPLLMPHGRDGFLRSLGPRSRILDVGCGNDSPFRTKSLRPQSYYVGVDVAEYRMHRPNVSDEYHLLEPDRFADGIGALGTRFDAVVSNHNLEHCADRQATLAAMLRAVVPGGRLYLAFPSAATVGFPGRQGTLNYRDDDTHVGSPPDVDGVVRTLLEHGFTVEFASSRYRPLPLAALGALQEPWSRRAGRVLQGTWALWGFESVVWARRGVAARP